MLVAAVALAGCAGTMDPVRSIRPETFVERAEVSASAQELVGQAEAEAAAAAAVDFALDHGVDPGLVLPREEAVTAAELSAGIADSLDPAVFSAWEQSVRSALAGDNTARDQTWALKLWGLELPGLAVPDDGNVARSQNITGLVVDTQAPASTIPAGTTAATEQQLSTGGPPSLYVTFTHEAQLVMEEDHTPVTVTVTREVINRMVRVEGTEETRWLIGEYWGTYSAVF